MLLTAIIKMPDSCCAVQCTNMRGKCDENIKFYRLPNMKNQQTTERRKKWVTAVKRENWPKSERQVNNARLCSEHFVTGGKLDDPLYIDYVPTVFAFVPVADASRKRKSIDRYERPQKRARNQNEKIERKDSPNKNKTTLYANVNGEHSVPDCVEQIEFIISN